MLLFLHNFQSFCYIRFSLSVIIQGNENGNISPIIFKICLGALFLKLYPDMVITFETFWKFLGYFMLFKITKFFQVFIWFYMRLQFYWLIKNTQKLITRLIVLNKYFKNAKISEKLVEVLSPSETSSNSSSADYNDDEYFVVKLQYTWIPCSTDYRKTRKFYTLTQYQHNNIIKAVCCLILFCIG